MNSLEKRMEKRFDMIQGDVKIIRRHLEEKNETIDTEYLQEKYSITCLFKSLPELDKFEQKLKANPSLRSHTVSLN